MYRSSGHGSGIAATLIKGRGTTLRSRLRHMQHRRDALCLCIRRWQDRCHAWPHGVTNALVFSSVLRQMGQSSVLVQLRQIMLRFMRMHALRSPS
jgi:hypothetical protein